jgi:hypothetical protein
MIAMRKNEDKYEGLAAANPDAYLADGFDDAYIGFTIGISPSVAVYDYRECVKVLVRDNKITEEEAIEYLDFNTVFAYVGQNTPLFLIRSDSNDD